MRDARPAGYAARSPPRACGLAGLQRCRPRPRGVAPRRCDDTANLSAKHRRHHALKTAGLWTARGDPRDGSLTWRTPGGQATSPIRTTTATSPNARRATQPSRPRAPARSSSRSHPGNRGWGLVVALFRWRRSSRWVLAAVALAQILGFHQAAIGSWVSMSSSTSVGKRARVATAATSCLGGVPLPRNLARRHPPAFRRGARAAPRAGTLPAASNRARRGRLGHDRPDWTPGDATGHWGTARADAHVYRLSAHG